MRFRFLSTLMLVLGACGGGAETRPVSPTTAKADVPSTSVMAKAPEEPPALPPISPAFPFQAAKTRGFSVGEPSSITPTKDGRFAFFLRATAKEARNSLWEVDVASGAVRELLRPDALAPENLSVEEKMRRERMRTRGGGFTSFEATSDGALLIVPLSGRLYALTRATGKTRQLATGPDVIDPHLSPDGTKVAYVRNNDVYMVPVDGGKEVAITRGGTNTNTHGVAEFLAQEEFARWRGFWWSPDSRSILYEEADLSAVPKWTLADPGQPEVPAHVIAYPQAGKPQAVVRLALASVRNPAAPARKISWDNTKYPFLLSVDWSQNAPPTLHVRDRLFRHGEVLAVDPLTGSTKTLVTEEDDTWLDDDSSVPRWLPDGSGFLWSTERSGTWELELRGRDGAKVSTVAAGPVGYRRLWGIDGDKRVAYIDASVEPMRDELWAAPLDGGAPRSISRNTDSRFMANFGESPRVHGFSEGTQSGEHRFGVRSVDGSVNVPIPSVAEMPPFKVNIEYTTIGKDSFRVTIVRPRDFDARRRYPIIDEIYGGPWSFTVSADANRYLGDQWQADVTQSIVVRIDAYGTQRRGRAWQRMFRGHMGDLMVNGHAQAIADLAKKYPEMDGSRVGICGWSFGGYATAMAILKRPDVFKAGVAGALVADQQDYDALVERFIGMPPSPDYGPASLLTWASRPPSKAAPVRPLLLIHGTADDNVYFFNALKFAEAMARAGRPLEFMPLIGQTHLVSDPDAYAAAKKRTAEYLREHLR